MKQFLASLGLSVVVLLAGVVFVVAACAVGCLFFAGRSTPTPDGARRDDGAGSRAADADFDGPPWALAQYRARRRGRRSPQEREAWRAVAAEEFDRVGGAPTRLAAAALVCRVSMERGAWDQTVTLRHADGATDEDLTGTAAPDLVASLEVGPGPARDALGPEDRHEATLAFPLTALPDGAVITLRAADRDLAVNDDAGESSTRYAGQLPIRFAGRRFTAECRGVPPARAEALAEPTLHALEALVRRFELPGYNEFEERGSLDARVATIQRDLISLADWLGWSHPAVRRLVEEADAVPRELPRQIAATLRALPLAREARVQDAVRLRLAEWRCGAAARGRCGVGDDLGCVAEFELGRFDPEFPPIVREDVFLFGPEGRLRAAAFEALPRARRHCLAFDARTAPALRGEGAPAVIVFPNTSAPMRVQ